MKLRDWGIEEWVVTLMLVCLIFLLATFHLAAWRYGGKCDPDCAGCNAALQGGNE